MAASRAQPSTPFASREFNGEVLLEDLDDVRGVGPRQLHEAAAALRELEGLPVTQAAQRLTTLASSRFADAPSLAALLGRWARKLRADADVSALRGHLERLAVLAALVGVVRSAGAVRR